MNTFVVVQDFISVPLRKEFDQEGRLQINDQVMLVKISGGMEDMKRRVSSYAKADSPVYVFEAKEAYARIAPDELGQFFSS